ncbi:hypothetical protein DM02DRAFT_617044 [Periconia macrospinosa]|uniref:Uncharacterized protein n=1 Tax=Periconia macrospinosa TaxID=97972 RepID=A0A2V1DF82_9PLEO|nr:hypothetical protein DM02DRAFT_617044 [Periconia macrospinosa]
MEGFLLVLVVGGGVVLLHCTIAYTAHGTHTVSPPTWASMRTAAYLPAQGWPVRNGWVAVGRRLILR